MGIHYTECPLFYPYGGVKLCPSGSEYIRQKKLNGLNWTRSWNEWQVGFNNGDGVNYYRHLSSLTPAIRFIFQQSNVGMRGRFVYRVDIRNISSVPCRVHSSSTGALLVSYTGNSSTASVLRSGYTGHGLEGCYDVDAEILVPIPSATPFRWTKIVMFLFYG